MTECVYAEPKSYRCPSCSKMLASRQSLREHCRRHTGEGFVCDLCGQKFTTNSGFRKLTDTLWCRCGVVVTCWTRSNM